MGYLCNDLDRSSLVIASVVGWRDVCPRGPCGEAGWSKTEANSPVSVFYPSILTVCMHNAIDHKNESEGMLTAGREPVLRCNMPWPTPRTAHTNVRLAALIASSAVSL